MNIIKRLSLHLKSASEKWPHWLWAVVLYTAGITMVALFSWGAHWILY